ncbi:MAG: hypothetical protein AUK47_24385 [Deltaproteobacteria bacterium CG2_30_63_29]|nr:MAG: hypothetical protein AUK47_24385 [Deltaproteobacteria bacterium CG2_30_63_29]PJB35802.1 MAG: hypothetical protein CO108_24785 [Deltaproteobacteria bacterium CG_4_9_14_3_um_filter_63_12]
MEVLYPRCAGLDVHKDVVVACARVVGDAGVTQDIETARSAEAWRSVGAPRRNSLLMPPRQQAAGG